MFNFNDPEIKFALNAVRQACRLVRQVQAELLAPAMTKEDRSPVTVADFASQALVGRLLGQAFPEDPLVGEEDSSALRAAEAGGTLAQVTHFVGSFEPGAEAGAVCAWIDRGGGEPAGRFWTLDPIDGTKGFLRGDQYAVALALIAGGSVRLGVLGCPNLADGYRPQIGGPGSLLVAARGEGAWVAPLEGGDEGHTRLRVSERSDLAAARLLRSFESGHTNISQVDRLAEALGRGWHGHRNSYSAETGHSEGDRPEAQAEGAQAIRMDSQAKYAVLAAGQAELYVRLLSPRQPDYREKIWDQAAGSLLVEEAGGRVSDLDGEALDFSAGRTLARNRGVLATNGRMHEAALQALRAIGA
jgi:3'(2'), 5'-bisphosphate nucleotidase